MMFILATETGFALEDAADFRKLELNAAGMSATALAEVMRVNGAFQTASDEGTHVWVRVDWIRRQLDAAGVADWQPQFAAMIAYAAKHGWTSESAEQVRVHVSNLAKADGLCAPDPAMFRNAMALLGGGVNIITTDGSAGRAGFAATAVCSVTDEPPTLLVCVNRTASSYPALTSNGVLCVNVLGSGHKELSARFGSKIPLAERFASGQWSHSSTGAPILQGATAAFDCRIVRRTEVGTHDVLFCEVQSVQLGEPENGGLVYFNRRYHELTHTETCG